MLVIYEIFQDILYYILKNKGYEIDIFGCRKFGDKNAGEALP